MSEAGPNNRRTTDDSVERYLPAPDEAVKEVTEGQAVDWPEWLKRAFLLRARVQEAALRAQDLREGCENLCRNIPDLVPPDKYRALLKDYSNLPSGPKDGTTFYQRVWGRDRLAAILGAFDRETLGIGEVISHLCFVPRALAGQPLTPLMARYQEYCREYRHYLRTALTEGRRDRVREGELGRQWMDHIMLIGITAHEIGEHLTTLEKNHHRPNGPGQAAENKVQLTDTEENILEALGDAHMTGPILLKKAGYDYSSHYRGILSQLVKREILGNDQSGYFHLKT